MVVTILNAILLWLILGTDPGWSWLMTLQRYTPSFKASWKLPSGKGSPATASSQLFASASICGSCFASCCKEGEKCIKLLLKVQNPFKMRRSLLPAGRKILIYHHDTAPQYTNTQLTHCIAYLFPKLSGHSVSLWSLSHVCQPAILQQTDSVKTRDDRPTTKSRGELDAALRLEQ